MAKIDTIIKTFANDSVLSACEAVFNLCDPLFKLGITEFSYLHLFNDGRRIDLCSNLEWSIDYLESFFDLRYADNVLYELNLDNKRISVADEMSDNSVLIDANNKFGIRNALSLFVKTPIGQEIFYFASKNDSKYMLDCYLNNLEFLKQFQFYFKEKAKRLIQLGFEANFQTPKNYYGLIKEKIDLGKKEPNLFSNLPITKYLLGDAFNHQYLTAREVECIKWALLGKTADETAVMLGVSKRTIEVHLENAKQKLGCTSKYQLIGKVIELGILKPSVD